jgi:predicted nucleic acid-binding protein
MPVSRSIETMPDDQVERPRMMAADHAQVLTLAERAGLTTYDASYLWLARVPGAALVTLDPRLAKAAEILT